MSEATTKTPISTTSEAATKDPILEKIAKDG